MKPFTDTLPGNGQPSRRRGSDRPATAQEALATESLLQRLCFIELQVASLTEKLRDIADAQQPLIPETLTVNQFAQYVNRRPYTCREWCRAGRIICSRANTGRGPYRSYVIGRDELRRYLEQGLLPLENAYRHR
jgi:hypothetical protein